MKFRIQNINTGNYFSQPIPHEVALKFLAELNAFGAKFKVVPVELETKNLSPVLKPMSEDVKAAIKNLPNITYAPNTNHSSFADTLLQRTLRDKIFEISEKEEAYLWYIVHRYRRQVEDQKLVQVSIQNKVY